MEEKPSLPEVLHYTRRVFLKIIGKRSLRGLPQEQKDEMLQDAYCRIIEKYPEFNSEKSWKALVFAHARGAILDYAKSGGGFEEQRWSIQKPEEVGNTHVGKLSQRLSLQNVEGEESDVDEVAGRNGVFFELLDKVQINWSLLARLSYTDKELRVFAWYLRGHTYEAIGDALLCGAARVGQICQTVIARFDSPDYASLDHVIFNQTCYALGISELLGFKHKNWSGSNVAGFVFTTIGCSNPEVDLDNLPVPPKQMTFFETHPEEFMQAAENAFLVKGGLKAHGDNKEQAIIQ